MHVEHLPQLLRTDLLGGFLEMNARVVDQDRQRAVLLVRDDSGQRPLAEASLVDPACATCTAHYPMALAISSDGRTVAVVGRAGRVSLISMESGRLLADRTVGSDLRGVVWGTHDRLFITSFGSGEVVVLNGRE